ncbi:unnamed protein product, partial [Ostreobium quekettii]
MYRCEKCSRHFDNLGAIQRHAKRFGARCSAVFGPIRNAHEEDQPGVSENSKTSDSSDLAPADRNTNNTDNTDNSSDSDGGCGSGVDGAYDPQFKLIHFMHTCNGGKGLSKNDMQDLLNIVHHPEFDATK